jgi:hypothetical protein
MILLLAAGCSRVGGVAQLGEHLLCKQGVIGSIPIVSIPPRLSSNEAKPRSPLTAAMVCLQTMRAEAACAD